MSLRIERAKISTPRSALMQAHTNHVLTRPLNDS